MKRWRDKVPRLRMPLIPAIGRDVVQDTTGDAVTGARDGLAVRNMGASPDERSMKAHAIFGARIGVSRPSVLHNPAVCLHE